MMRFLIPLLLLVASCTFQPAMAQDQCLAKSWSEVEATAKARNLTIEDASAGVVRIVETMYNDYYGTHVKLSAVKVLKHKDIVDDHFLLALITGDGCIVNMSLIPVDVWRQWEQGA